MFFIIIIVAFLILSASPAPSAPVQPWSSNIEKDTIENTKWRDVVQTSKGLQISLMSVPPGESLGEEVHAHSDQFFRFESGSGTVKIADTSIPVSDGSAVVVPMGATHDVQNTSTSKPLKFYTIYAPPHHPRARWISRMPMKSTDMTLLKIFRTVAQLYGHGIFGK